MRNAFLLSCLAVLAACGDNNSSGDDDTVPVDANETPPDAVACPAREAGQVGGACALNADCDSTQGAGDGICYTTLDQTVFEIEGYCTLDDNTTGTICATDDDCGAGNVCVDFLDFTPYHVCMPACDCPGNACPPHQACWNTFNGFALDKSACVPGNDSASDGDPCGGIFDCNEFSGCLNDVLEFPGGQCDRYGCTVGDDSTCNGGHCVNVNETPLVGTLCVDACETGADCRVAEGYVCYDPGAGGEKYCRHPHVGDPCTTADDCGTGTWTCQTGAFVGGYCTQTGCPNPGSSNDQCSPGSVCTDPLVGANYCADRCAPADNNQQTCRTGYFCADVDPGAGVVGGCVPPASI